MRAGARAARGCNAVYGPQDGPGWRWREEGGRTEGVVGVRGANDGARWGGTFLVVWGFAGFYMLRLLGGLQNVPGDVDEAAKVGGAETGEGSVRRGRTMRWILFGGKR